MGLGLEQRRNCFCDLGRPKQGIIQHTHTNDYYFKSQYPSKYFGSSITLTLSYWSLIINVKEQLVQHECNKDCSSKGHTKLDKNTSPFRVSNKLHPDAAEGMLALCLLPAN